MNYVNALFIKFLMIFVVFWGVFYMLFGIGFGDIVLASVILSPVVFAFDFISLPRMGDVSALVADYAISFVGIWALAGILFGGIFPLILSSLFAALMLSLGELVYHQFLKENEFINTSVS